MTAVSQPSGTVTLVFTDIEGSTGSSTSSAWTPTRRARRASPNRPRGLPRHRASRSTTRETPSSTPSRPGRCRAPSRSKAASRAADLDPRRHPHGRAAADRPSTSAWTSISPPGSMSSAHGGQVVVTQAPADFSTRASASATSESTASRISRRRSASTSSATRLPFAQDAPPDEPADPSDTVSRSREGARRGVRAARP